MSRNGSGQMNLPAGNPVVSGTIIDPVAFNSTMSDIANEITNSIPRDGQAPPTNNLPMGAYRHTNVANAQNRNEYATAAQVQDAAILTLSGVTGTDTITATINPPITAYAAGQKFKGVLAGTNTTTSPTLNINSIGAVAIVMPGGGTPAVGALPANGAEFYYNGANFVLMNPVIAAGAIGTSQLAAGAATLAKLDQTGTAGQVLLGQGASTPPAWGQVGSSQLAAGSATLAKLDQTGLSGQVLSGQGNGSAPAWAYPVLQQRSGLSVTYTGTSGVVTVTANALSLQNAIGQAITLTGFNQSATSGNASGVVNSLDTGNWAFSTWYNTFAIYNPTTQTRGLLFSTATIPTLPSGFTFWTLVSTAKTQAATNYWFLGATQYYDLVQYKVNTSGNVAGFPLMISGAQGSVSTPTWVAVSVSPFVPPNAYAIRGLLLAQNSNTVYSMAAPNNSYGALSSTTNPPPVTNGAAGVSVGLVVNVPFEMVLEGSNIYYAANSATGTGLYCTGWRLNL